MKGDGKAVKTADGEKTGSLEKSKGNTKIDEAKSTHESSERVKKLNELAKDKLKLGE